MCIWQFSVYEWLLMTRVQPALCTLLLLTHIRPMYPYWGSHEYDGWHEGLVRCYNQGAEPIRSPPLVFVNTGDPFSMKVKAVCCFIGIGDHSSRISHDSSWPVFGVPASSWKCPGCGHQQKGIPCCTQAPTIPHHWFFHFGARAQPRITISNASMQVHK